jgi:restriction system protein
MYRPPWQRDWLDVSPAEFEILVVEWLKQEFGAENLRQFTIEHQAELESADGIRCKLDALVSVRLAGMDYVTVVECKHQGRPVEGEVVDALAKKVERYGHKGLLVSTGGFQRGALQRAEVEKIALVHMTAGGPVYRVRNREGMPGGEESTHEFHLVRPAVEGTTLYRLATAEALADALGNPGGEGAGGCGPSHVLPPS